jgi:hypothetical protein
MAKSHIALFFNILSLIDVGKVESLAGKKITQILVISFYLIVCSFWNKSMLKWNNDDWLYPFQNAIWFGLGWSLFFFIPCFIFAALLSNLYKRTEKYRKKLDRGFDDPWVMFFIFKILLTLFLFIPSKSNKLIRCLLL